jgi:diguanylate cyclase
MTTVTQPSEIAREALRRLAVQRLQPTPDNYRALYHEIAGTQQADAFPDRPLRAISGALPRATPAQLRFANRIEAAVAERSWGALRTALQETARDGLSGNRDWAALIRDLLLQLERRQSGSAAAKKRGALEHALGGGGTSDALYDRLQSLARAWSQSATPDTTLTGEIPPESAGAEDVPGSAMTATAARRSVSATSTEPIARFVARLLQEPVRTLLADIPELADDASRLADRVRAATSQDALLALAGDLEQFGSRLKWAAADQHELKGALLRLLQLVIQNITTLMPEDQWLRGQVAMLEDLFRQPLNLHRVEDMQRRLQDVIEKQSALRQNLIDAQDRLKAMLAGFVDHLAGFTDTTSEYHDRIASCSSRISEARDVSELSAVVEEVLQQTAAIQAVAARSRDELRAMKERASDAEKAMVLLQHQLEETSQMVRHDQLTGALNRKGLNEAFEREVGRARRKNAPVSVGLLDLDNFKQLNDTHGHQTGDEALVHLVGVVRETLRAVDTVARYGGEEFLILLPETDLEEAKVVLTRLQRELTRRIFLHENERVLITFSAGVAEVRADETQEQAIARADAAMYEAKRAGKNRVIAAP